MKVGDLVTRPMVQHTCCKGKAQVSQSNRITAIEIDRRLPELAGGFDSTVTVILIQLSCEIAVNGSSEPVWLRGHPAQQVSAQAPSA